MRSFGKNLIELCEKKNILAKYFTRYSGPRGINTQTFDFI